MGNSFELEASLRQVHRIIPKWPWTLQDQMYSLYVLQLLIVWNSSPFRSVTSRFGVTGHFDTSAPNDPQMTSNTKRLKVPHIYCIRAPESQISLHLALRPAAFEVQANLSQAHRMTTKKVLNNKGKIYPIYVRATTRTHGSGNGQESVY